VGVLDFLVNPFLSPGVEELEGGVDLAVGLVAELADLDAVHQERADLGLA
jgi:hypothetical protein